MICESNNYELIQKWLCFKYLWNNSTKIKWHDVDELNKSDIILFYVSNNSSLYTCQVHCGKLLKITDGNKSNRF